MGIIVRYLHVWDVWCLRYGVHWGWLIDSGPYGERLAHGSVGVRSSIQDGDCIRFSFNWIPVSFYFIFLLFYFFFAFSVMAGLLSSTCTFRSLCPVPLSVALYGPHFVHADSHYLPAIAWNVDHAASRLSLLVSAFSFPLRRPQLSICRSSALVASVLVCSMCIAMLFFLPNEWMDPWCLSVSMPMPISVPVGYDFMYIRVFWASFLKLGKHWFLVLVYWKTVRLVGFLDRVVVVTG